MTDRFLQADTRRRGGCRQRPEGTAPRSARPATGQAQPAPESRPAPARRLVPAVGAALCVLVGVSCRQQRAAAPGDTIQVQRAPLEISVVESGSLEAAESITIVNRVNRPTEIVSIVPEGTWITEADADAGKVLVELDASSLKEGLYRHETDVESNRASLTQAQEQLIIQRSENDSNIRTAELDIVYARNELRRLVGDAMAERLAAGLPADVAGLLEQADLGGQAREELRSLRAGIELARTGASRAEEKVGHTRRLFERQYVSRSELEADELDMRTRQMALASAQGKLAIFRQYDFGRDLQRAQAARQEAEEKLVRARAVARSREAQAQARLRSCESAFERSRRHLEEHRRDIENCTIRATRPGFVIYQAPEPWENRGPLREGVEVRRGQVLLRLPDLSRMAVVVRVHEAQIGAVAEGQRAFVRIDGIPGRTFVGDVVRKAHIPSGRSQWPQPDLKAYDCKVLLADQDVSLRPGMTATVTILCERVEDVLQVPIQSVTVDHDGRQWVCRPDGTPVPVRTGRRNHLTIAIDEGLAEGDTIRLNPCPDPGGAAAPPTDGPGRS